MGREAFLERVWKWKAESGGTITRQLRRMGACLDWSRERFTMDEGLSVAVREVFVTLHRQGLIYRDRRLVNWDPKFQTAISDLEVESREVKGSLWHLRYPVEGEPGRLPRRSRPRGRRRCWATPPWPCTRTTTATATWSASTWSCRSSAAASPSSPMPTRTRRRARAR